MTKPQDHTGIIQDISLLYELALSIGHSMDLKTTCDVFLKTLMARKNLDYAAVWLRQDVLAPEEESAGVRLAYANPRFRGRETSLDAHHPILHLLQPHEAFSRSATHPQFDELVTENDLNKGTFAVFPLGKIGFLKLHSSVRSQPFEMWELNKLQNVIAKFAVSLQGCLDHQRLREEIFERKLAERALLASEQRYRALYEDTPSMYFTLDGEGRILSVNQFGAEQLGYEVEELRGRALAETSWADDRAMVAHELAECLSHPGLMRQWQTRRVAKSGALFWVEEFARALPEVQGRPQLLLVCQDISMRKRIEEGLRSSLREKEMLLKEIHHRVKNNMQIVSSLLNLQAGYIQDHNVLALFKESDNRIRTMALIHERLYQSSNLADIAFKEYLPTLTDYLRASYSNVGNNVTLKLQVEDIYLGIDAAIPCGLIINELISNAFKHAFPGKATGQVSIAFVRRNGTPETQTAPQLVLIIRDDGVGFPHGVDFRQTKSLGLKLVVSLVRQLKGAIQKTEREGTEFIITFQEH